MSFLLPACPNQPPCGHFLHDIDEPGDPYPTCCIEGCRCGQPGEVVVTQHADGRATVVRADPVIRVSRDLLDVLRPPVWSYEDPTDGQLWIFGRVKS